MTKKESNILLFSITLCWASSYIFIKDLPEDLSSYAYLTLTSGLAGLILLVIFHRSLKKINRKTVLHGLILSGLLAGNMLLEKKGLEYIPSSTASFLASLNIMIVPLILLLFRRFPTRNNLAGIFIILTGLHVSNGFSLTGSSAAGTMCMLGACALMSIYTVAASGFTRKSDPLLLSVLQICFSAGIGFILWLLEDPATFAHITWSKRMLSSIFILAFFSKAYAYIMLMYAEKYADPISVTVIAATEPIVTLTLALMIPNMQGETETFSVRALAGAVVIAMGAIVAGTDFLSRGEKIEKKSNAASDDRKAKQEGNPDGMAEEKPGKRWTLLRQFLLVMIPFAVLGAAFKVMVLVEGFTEVRPANAIPTVAGLSFGMAGALGCAAGNLIADCFGTLNLTSLLGAVGNFMAAYIPYRLWHTISKESPNVRTWKNLLIYIWSSLLGSLACAWILGFGLELFFGIWEEKVYRYILLNNFGFSVCLGLPLLILVCSDSIRLQMRRPQPGRGVYRIPEKYAIGIFVAETAVLAVIMGGVYAGMHLSNSIIMRILCAAAVLLMAGMCCASARREE